MNLFNELVNQILSCDSILEEGIEYFGYADPTSIRGDTAENQFADLLRGTLGTGVNFKKGSNLPPKFFTKVERDFKDGKIAWYKGSSKMDRIDHIDFKANMAAKVDMEEVENLAKEQFADMLGLDVDIESPDFDMFWNDEEYAEQKEFFINSVFDDVKSSQGKDIRTFEVKSYKGDVKRMHGDDWTLVELVGKTGHPGWLYGKATDIAYLDKKGGVTGFTIVNRQQLANYVNKTVDKDDIVRTKPEAAYKAYMRGYENEKDKVSHIDLGDAQKNGVNVEFWRMSTSEEAQNISA